jgi:antitoxin Phd
MASIFRSGEREPHEQPHDVVNVAEYERLRHLERAQAPSFAEVLRAMPQDDGEFPRRDVRMRDLEV